MQFLEAALQRALGKTSLRIERTDSVSGGCIHEARRLVTTEGDFFAKWSARCPADIFLREAEGLDALRSVSTEIVIPRVIAAAEPVAGQPAFLVLEFLPPASRSDPSNDEKFGRGLATIHRSRAEGFGFSSPTYCGLTRQDNRWCASWPDFYRDCRLRPLLETLDEQGQLSAADRRLYDRLVDLLPNLLPKDAPPSLIHGDLWSGNVLSTTRGPALVDPSCAYADREMEFGMTTLFGGLSERAFSAYEDAWPLPAGWRERNPLYQLYHLLNHAVLFGGHYGAEARRLAMGFAG